MSLQKFSETMGETESHLHWQVPRIWQSVWRFILESLCVNTSQFRNKWVAERAVRRAKEGTSAVLLAIRCGHGNVSALCETFKISCLMGRHPTRGGSEYFLKKPGHSVWSDGRISPYFCQRLVATASVWSESLTRNIPRFVVYVGGNLERRHLGCRHWGIGTDGRIWNPCQETQFKGSVNAPKWWTFYFSDRRWNSHIILRSPGSENIHFDPGQPTPRRRTRTCSGRSRWVSTNSCSRLIAGWRWCKKRFLVHFKKLHLPSSRWTESQT